MICHSITTPPGIKLHTKKLWRCSWTNPTGESDIPSEEELLLQVDIVHGE